MLTTKNEDTRMPTGGERILAMEPDNRTQARAWKIEARLPNPVVA
jgi:hypothetical protein